ncbi:Acetyltransferase (plasmid) [Acidisarcina polymorpha]|uniref:Acetyltransferase n=1 Tax=Acidisarcina polymorpha TaxID=2211140 RepID=A0A2Z5GAY7_9BACT|nr:GNAT family N-acetyltransferase [Acidisarcina polymorpha]AXC16080.1 Acetyltransferase [Acidisarcina polymorpha]
MTAPFRLEPLSEVQDRSGFACGEEALDRYFQSQVTQDIRRHIANCFVAIDAATGALAGYYTIAATSIPTPDLPAEVTKRLPRYPSIPAVRIGRLAVDQKHQRRGLGAALLADAAQRTLDAPPAAYALVVDAKDDNASAFYQHHGFLRFASQPRTLFLPLATAAKILLGPA